MPLSNVYEYGIGIVRVSRHITTLEKAIVIQSESAQLTNCSQLHLSRYLVYIVNFLFQQLNETNLYVAEHLNKQKFFLKIAKFHGLIDLVVFTKIGEKFDFKISNFFDKFPTTVFSSYGINSL
ncbi:hypothetical protein T09_4673 [Trichinella sp. T9]|nr:hypothetical protein T09_4673 [Trichinella sp. T9]